MNKKLKNICVALSAATMLCPTLASAHALGKLDAFRDGRGVEYADRAGHAAAEALVERDELGFNRHMLVTDGSGSTDESVIKQKLGMAATLSGVVTLACA